MHTYYFFSHRAFHFVILYRDVIKGEAGGLGQFPPRFGKIEGAALKFIYSEMVTKFCEIFTLLLSYVVPVKSKLKILPNFVAFSECMNFNRPENQTFFTYPK